ncbi:hypothetical protein [Streptomyces sp. URMC 123]|uniref:hypothetical protein n=1 Tax=Streptomyces sp. URMC 123 TaxID=3423403 RepID=UPI003F1BA3D3
MKIEQHWAGGEAYYLILVGGNRELSVDGGDDWAKDDDYLRGYFEESDWVVEWEDGGVVIPPEGEPAR